MDMPLDVVHSTSLALAQTVQKQCVIGKRMLRCVLKRNRSDAEVVEVKCIDARAFSLAFSSKVRSTAVF
jgi:hypothetical protein